MTMTMKNFITNVLNKLAKTSCIVSTVALSAGLASAQEGNLGDSIRDAVGNQLNSATAGQNDLGQNPTQRGVNQAVQGLIQGQNAGDAIRGGLNEAAQSAGETSQQTLQRDQLRNQTNLQNNQPMVQGNVQANSSGQVWQTDQQGRLYFVDGNGQVIYHQHSENRQLQPNASGTNQSIQNGQLGQNGVTQTAQFGANFEARQHGIAATSVQSNSWASTTGIQQGDILLSIDGQPVQGVQGIQARLESLRPDQQTELMVMRGGQRYLLRAMGPGRSATDRQSMAKPAIKDAGMSSRFDEIQREVDQLRKELDGIKLEMKNNHSTNGRKANAEVEVQNETRADLNKKNLQDDK